MRLAARERHWLERMVRNELRFVIEGRSRLLLGLKLELIVVLQCKLIVIFRFLRVDTAGRALGRFLQGEGRQRVAASDPVLPRLALLH